MTSKKEAIELTNSILYMISGKDRHICLKALMECIFVIRQAPDGVFTFEELIRDIMHNKGQ